MASEQEKDTEKIHEIRSVCNKCLNGLITAESAISQIEEILAD